MGLGVFAHFPTFFLYYYRKSVFLYNKLAEKVGKWAEHHFYEFFRTF